MTSAPNSPAELEAKYQGEVRAADGYQYWATSPEDEDAGDLNDMAKRLAEQKPIATKPKRQVGKAMSRWIVRLIVLALVGAIAYIGFSFSQVYNAASDDDVREVDAIVVMGAAQWNGEPSDVLRARLDHAFRLWGEDLAPRILTTGGNQPGDAATEGSTGFDYLLQKGVPERDLVLIDDGDNTYQQLTAAAFQIEELELETVVLVSDGYHNFRLREIADEVGINASVSPSGVDGSAMNYARETAAVSIGRIFGYRRLSSLTTD